MKRREFLHATLGSLVAAGTSFPLTRSPQFRADPFSLSVASGDPVADGVVLWTRLAPDLLNGDGMGPEAVSVEWRVAADEQMRRVVRQGTEIAKPELAHSVHAEVRGLEPDRWYWYQFLVGSGANRLASPIGRTKTAAAPGSRTAQFRFAFASCQRYEDGYYTAYQHMADEDVDLVVHLGDYIYEGGRAANRPRFHPADEAVTLEQYRQRYALYKSDPDLRRVHELFPWAVTPDDHEVSNNYAGDFPEGAGARDAFLQRRAAAYQAYYEHLPLRPASLPRHADIRLYRSLSFGDLIRFSILDTRQHRDDQPCGDGERAICAEALRVERAMMGTQQETWLTEGLSKSKARWNVLAQQVIMSQIDVDSGADEIYSMDMWNGYPAARERLMGLLESKRPSNPIVLSGDNHNHWVFDLKRDVRNPKSPVLATEFVGSSISSGRDGSEQDSKYALALPSNPHAKFLNSRRGYVRCLVTPELWTTDLRVVPYIERPGAPVETRATFVVENGKPGALRS